MLVYPNPGQICMLIFAIFEEKRYLVIARYLTKEIILTFLAIVSLLLLIALSNRFALYLAKAATGELPVSLVLRLVLLYVPELSSFVIPLGFLLAILFTYGRLHADSEMVVLLACGLGWSYITRLTLMLAAIVTVGVGALTCCVIPRVTFYREQLSSEGEALAVLQSFLPGRFQAMSEGKRIFYLEEASSDNKTLKGVFIAEQPSMNASETANWTLLMAEAARIVEESGGHDFYLVLNDGYRYQGRPGTANYTQVKFKEYGRAIKQTIRPVSDTAVRLRSSASLLKFDTPEDVAEFQWRLSIPLSIPILGLLGVPLAYVRPRQGRFAQFLPAILLYILYYNLFTLSKRWIISGALPSFIGVWWVHLLFLGLGWFLLLKRSGWLNRYSRLSQR